jgi:hypothetical protein
MATKVKKAKKIIVDEMVGACEVCGYQFMGRVHNCPGLIERDESQRLLQGAQFEEDIEAAEYRQEGLNGSRRRFGERLADGFELLADSGWGSSY